MRQGISQQLTDALVGESCIVERGVDCWCFRFGEALTITIQATWRLVQDGAIQLGSEDDGHKFGLPSAVDGEARAVSILRDRRVINAHADEATGDLSVTFDGGARLDVFNHSAGYEGWVADLYRPPQRRRTIVARGGGSIVVAG